MEEGICRLERVAEGNSRLERVEGSCRLEKAGEGICILERVGEGSSKLVMVGEVSCTLETVAEESCKLETVEEESNKLEMVAEGSCRLEMGEGEICTQEAEEMRSSRLEEIHRRREVTHRKMATEATPKEGTFRIPECRLRPLQFCDAMSHPDLQNMVASTGQRPTMQPTKAAGSSWSQACNC